MNKYTSKLNVTEFKASNLLDKDCIDSLFNDFVMTLCKTAVASFFEDNDGDVVNSWIASQAYIIDLQDAGTVNLSGAIELSMYATSIMNIKGKGETANGKSERRRNVDSGRNTRGNGASRSGKSKDNDCYNCDEK